MRFRSVMKGGGSYAEDSNIEDINIKSLKAGIKLPYLLSLSESSPHNMLIFKAKTSTAIFASSRN